MKSTKLFICIFILVALLLTCLLREPASHTETEFIMDTIVSVTAYGKNAKKAVQGALARIREIDARFDAFDAQSDVAVLNAAPALVPVPVNAEVYGLLQRALDYNRLTQGDFDITLLSVSQLWGFGTERKELPTQAALTEALQKTGCHNLKLDPDALTVTKLKEGIMLDFGGIVKGYAADEAVKVLQAAGISHAYLDLGGNIAVLGGKPYAPLMRLVKNAKARPFTIGIQKPDATRGEIIKALHITDGFVVTSGDYERYVTIDGKRYHHILDPKTGYPADSGLKSVTVLCQSGLAADICSTALFVGGSDMHNTLSALYDAAIFVDEAMAVKTLTN